MKAKELADKWNTSKSIETLSYICNHYWREIFLIVETRHAKTDSAMIAVLNELDNKWKAMCRFTDDLKVDGFEIIVKSKMPEVFDAWRGTK